MIKSKIQIHAGARIEAKNIRKKSLQLINSIVYSPYADKQMLIMRVKIKMMSK